MATSPKPKRPKPDPKAAAKTKPVRVDLPPDVHKALRRRAADEDLSMAALARHIIARELGFKE
jgi:hypothetical protein